MWVFKAPPQLLVMMVVVVMVVVVVVMAVVVAAMVRVVPRVAMVIATRETMLELVLAATLSAQRQHRATPRRLVL
jgi:hypothetical protein